ncbi:3-hydroxyisobutyrate dehydrogenase, mitochondrial [Cimex lectularius]|uniref:3-hydroxyisobutyrate dehydrogenase n=1 Tax=Cimex lectularius TaxID=79782 RepID=A0A8I6RNT1_CIMLE|nr:3-hydroxyisobutyrate dehydrogenase, mitochondrial [Cimex lectularius]
MSMLHSVRAVFVGLKTSCQQIRLQSTSLDGTPLKKLGFIGLGNMGASMSMNLVKKGFDVTVFDINKAACERVSKVGAKVAGSTQELAQNVEFILTMLPASPHLKSLYLEDDGLSKFLDKNKFIIDMSTIDPSVSKELAKHFETVGAKFIDAPVSGGIKAAEDGTLTFMVGGDPSVVETAKPVLLAMGSRVIYCGAVSSGQVAKTCNNLILGISMAAVSEAMNLGVKLGLDPKLLASVINSSSGRCWSSDTYNPVPGVMENVPSSKDYKAGFTTEMLAKDLKIAENAAKEIGLTLEVGKKTLEIYENIITQQLGHKDFSFVYKHFTDKQTK